MAGYSVEGFKLWVEVGDEPIAVDDPDPILFDCVSASAEFSLNTIPRAQCSLALGRRADDLTQIAAIHTAINTLAQKQRAQIFLQAANLDVAGQLLGGILLAGITHWPATPVRIFDGYTTGGGYDRSDRAASYTLHLEHWLADLAFSASLSSQLHPANPADLTLGGFLPFGGGGGFVGLEAASQFINSTVIARDYWGEGLKRFFIKVASQNALKKTALPSLLGDTPDSNTTNSAALKALNRIEPTSFDPITQAGVYKNGVPSGLNNDPLSAGDMVNIAKNMATDASALTLLSMSGHTLWDKLAGNFTASYMLAVVPRVETALVVPFVPAVRQPYKTIAASEYDFVRLSGDMPRVLRGVGIFGGKRFVANAGLPGASSARYQDYGIGGFYPAAQDGLLLFTQAPAWMANVPLYSATSATLGAAQAIADGFNPGIGAAAALNQPGLLKSLSRVMSSYAHCVYLQEALKFRVGMLAGRLRFDITPGATVRIEVEPEPFIGPDDQLGNTLYATVLGVGWHLDMSQQRAGATYELGYVRNEAENKLENFSVAQHPLWQQQFTGAPLVDL